MAEKLNDTPEANLSQTTFNVENKARRNVREISHLKSTEWHEQGLERPTEPHGIVQVCDTDHDVAHWSHSSCESWHKGSIVGGRVQRCVSPTRERSGWGRGEGGRGRRGRLWTKPGPWVHYVYVLSSAVALPLTAWTEASRIDWGSTLMFFRTFRNS